MAGQVAVRLRENSFKDKYERYILTNPNDADLKRKALTAVAAKMAPGNVRHDQEEPALSAVLRAEFAQWIDPSQQGRRGAGVAGDPLDNARTFRWVAHAVLGTVKILRANSHQGILFLLWSVGARP